MHRDLFEKYKKRVIDLVNKDLASDKFTPKQRADLHEILDILDKHYQFDNWKFHQGLLSHVIVDSMDLHNDTSDAAISFDKYLY